MAGHSLDLNFLSGDVNMVDPSDRDSKKCLYVIQHGVLTMSEVMVVCDIEFVLVYSVNGVRRR